MSKKEKRGIYNVAYNNKKHTNLRDIELIENTVIDKLIYVVKGYHKKNNKHGYGTEHIKFRHLDNPNKRGYIKLDELVNLGNSMRAYVRQFKKPFIDKNNAKIYEWQDDDKIRFRLIVDKKKIKINKKASMNPRHTSISQVHTLTNQGTNATSIANVIISFYSDRNLKRSMKFKNPQVEKFYKNLKSQTQQSQSSVDLIQQNANLTQITIDTADIAPKASAMLVNAYDKCGENALANTLINTISADEKVMQSVQRESENLIQQESEQSTQSVDEVTQTQQELQELDEAQILQQGDDNAQMILGDEIGKIKGPKL